MILGPAIRARVVATSIAATVAVVSQATTAAADDAQAWTAFEARVPISDGKYGLPQFGRVVSEARFGGPREGLSFALLRASAMWELHPSFGVNLNGVQALPSEPKGAFTPESRFEIEPNVRFTAGPLHVNVRQRVDFRFIAAELRPRYRMQLRVNFQPTGWRVVPFVAGEVHVITRLRVSEERTLIGVSFIPQKHLRIDAAYMVRPRVVGDDWFVTHASVLTFTFTPQAKLLFESGGG